MADVSVRRTTAAPGPAGRPRKVLYLVTEDWYFCSHRLPIARGARAEGFDVIVATRVDTHGERITAEGFRLVPLPWRRRSRNVFAELAAFARIVRLYRRERPDVVHHVALKPTLYGSLARLFTRHRPAAVNAVAGFGYIATSRQAKARLLRPVFRWVFRRLVNRPGNSVIVQNPDDRDALISGRLVDADRIQVIRGAGVDLERFTPAPEPADPVTVAMVSRMLWSKGVGAFVAAARDPALSGLRFVLAGAPDEENPEAVPAEELRAWRDGGVVSWLGHVDDVEHVWRDAHIAVLPTRYAEGLPKCLLEAAACGRPIVTTDAPGCREIVENGSNGLLVAPGDPAALARAIAQLAGDADLRQRMGRAGRRLVERSFGEAVVVSATVAMYNRMAPRSGRETHG